MQTALDTLLAQLRAALNARVMTLYRETHEHDLVPTAISSSVNASPTVVSSASDVALALRATPDTQCIMGATTYLDETLREGFARFGIQGLLSIRLALEPPAPTYYLTVGFTHEVHVFTPKQSAALDTTLAQLTTTLNRINSAMATPTNTVPFALGQLMERTRALSSATTIQELLEELVHITAGTALFEDARGHVVAWAQHLPYAGASASASASAAHAVQKPLNPAPFSATAGGTGKTSPLAPPAPASASSPPRSTTDILSKQLLLGAASALEKSDHPLWITGVEPPRYVLPVRINGRLAGILSVIPAHAQLEGEIAFTLECVATYAQIAAGRLLASHDTARATLLRRSLTTTEAERMRIAQDLRDNSSQNLVALKVELACAAAALEKNPAAATGHLDNAQRVADSLLTEINTTSTNLRPNELDYLGFAKAIETYATRELAPSSCAFRLAGNALTADFSPLVELHLLRVAQEGVRNIARHARADEAVLTLNHEGDFVTLYLADNGCGFDVATQPLESNAPGAYGLKSMRDRIDMMGGRFWIGSQPGAGTRIICRIPCEEALA